MLYNNNYILQVPSRDFYFKGIRGGLVQASMRHAKANNHKAPGYNKSKSESWLVYQDCKFFFFFLPFNLTLGNNLYGYAMSQYMPYGGFKWVKPELCGLDALTPTSDIGRVYEVDISYPHKLHNKHNDLPFLPENSIPKDSKVQKLMATFVDKKNYIVHYQNLQQAITNGLIVKKVNILFNNTNIIVFNFFFFF